MTHHFRTTCPFCGEYHDRVTGISDEEAMPEDGDASMCFCCGEVNVVDGSCDDGLRRPTVDEQRILDGDPRIIDMKAAWKKVRTVRQ